MPTCTVILHRHSGLSRVCRPSEFAAQALKPMLEGKMTNGNALHILHDRIPCHPMNDEIKKDFEAMLKNRKLIRVWKKFDREWKEDAKRALKKADQGEDSAMLTRDFCPDAKLILETNKQRPGTIINHVGFYPFEAAIEYTRCSIHTKLSRERASLGDLKGSTEHLMEAHNALASCNLLRDIDLIRQIKLLGLNVVVFRDMHHTYLADLERFDIPIVEGRFSIKNFHEIVAESGITIKIIHEEVPPTYGETAVNVLCSGGIDNEMHRELALKEMIFVSFMQKYGGWNDIDQWAAAYSVTERDYEQLRQEVFG